MAAPAHGHAKSLTKEEKANAPKVTKELLGRIFGYLKPYWLQLLFVFVAILAAAVVGLFPSIITGKIVDEALVGMAVLPLLIIPARSVGGKRLALLQEPQGESVFQNGRVEIGKALRQVDGVVLCRNARHTTDNGVGEMGGALK
ncbi:MAG: hypothetical protein PUD81_03480 [Eggerthellales bacterium]|nr:hypothetical protein [Eggerthellales bacterium]